MRFIRSFLLIVVALTVVGAFGASAQEYTSTNYKVVAPTIFPGGYSSSPSFGLAGVISQIASGSSTASSFKDFAGFLYFPFVSTPVLSATAGNAQVTLSWTAADSGVGWAVSGYNIGRATASGGPYTYTNVGNVLASIEGGLANSTPYFFVLQIKDALGNPIATSTEVTATPVPSSSGGGGSGGGGGGGGGGGSNTYGTGINFSGRAYPQSLVTILKDASVLTTIVADSRAYFASSIPGITPGNYFFSAYSEDAQGRRSSLLTFPVSIKEGIVTNITGIYIAPTIAVEKSQVKRGDDIAIFGQTASQSSVTIQVNSDQPMFVQTVADAGGVYLYNFNTTPLEYGDHSTKSKSAAEGEISSYSSAVPFVVGTKNVAALVASKICDGRGDLNNDCKVNLVDFSIMAYWYKRASPPAHIDLNHDLKVDLTDFSILAFYWTG